MKRALLSVLVLSTALAPLAVAAGPPGAPPPPTLRWTNGESMAADLVEATGTTATWKSPEFEEPVQLAWSVIHRVDWSAQPASPARVPLLPLADNHLETLAKILRWHFNPVFASILTAPTPSPFLFTFRDGSALQADILALTGTSVSVWAQRFGEVTLDRSQILAARRRKNSNLLLAGPAGDTGWRPVEAQQNGQTSSAPGAAEIPALTTGAGDVLQFPYWNRAAKLGMNLPDSVDIEFHLHAAGRPAFCLTIGPDHARAIRLETWDSDLVVDRGGEFQLVRHLADSDQDISLRFCWDCKSGHCAIFTPAGESVANWQAPVDNGRQTPGLVLTNQGRDLTLDYLRIRKWNGAPPPRYDPNKPRIEMDDGRILPATIASGSAGSVLLSGSSTQPGNAISLRDVDAMIFSTDSPASTPAQSAITYADGTLLHGQISGIKNGRITLVTAFANQPLRARTESIRHLLLPSTLDAAAPPLTRMDSLKIGRDTFHGTLVTSGGSAPRWLPVGGFAPVTLSPAEQYQIARYFAPTLIPSTTPALFYTRAGDALPGNLHAIDRSGIDFDSPLVPAGHLPTADLSAIQFDPGSRGATSGFNASIWRLVNGKESMIQRSGNSIHLNPGAAIGNSQAMQSSEIRFTIRTDGFWGMRLRLFCAENKPTAKLLISGMNGGVTSGLELNDNQIDDFRFNGRAPTSAIAVRLVIQADGVEIYYNGLLAQKVPIPGDRRLGDGLVIEPMGIWGNNPQPVEIDNFSLVAAPGSVWLPAIDPDAKSQALSIPRFRRNDPPSHALIAANGDVLRGEIEAATTTNFGFRTGMDHVVVPRDRVKAVICLPKPVDGQQPTPPPKDPAKDMLAQMIPFGVNLSVQSTNMLLRNAADYLKSQIPALKFTFPKHLPKTSGMLQIGTGTLESSLDKLAAFIGCTYHLDSSGTIVFETADSTSLSDPIVRRVYWLKPGSFPVGDSVQKLLAAKGIPFPPGASASWDAGAGQLTVENTQPNHARLGGILTPDYGGIIGLPNYWLVLTNGGHLALAVDQFGPDKITGSHPLYGRCAIPAADVAMVRNYPLGPSGAMMALADWKPVYAPDPVLPDAGGDSSASVGKPAAQFKLPMLGGGQFDLAQERGKIVILDFWATWCGPCVHSLPALIQSMSPFPSEKVKFIGVDQDEPADQVSRFLETRGWTLPVALDVGGQVSQQYGADTIPHTVVIGPDGKVAWVKTGYTPDEEGDTAKEVTELLSHPAAPPAAVRPVPAS